VCFALDICEINDKLEQNLEFIPTSVLLKWRAIKQTYLKKDLVFHKNPRAHLIFLTSIENLIQSSRDDQCFCTDAFRTLLGTLEMHQNSEKVRLGAIDIVINQIVSEEGCQELRKGS
jgi:gluconate kinase